MNTPFPIRDFVSDIAHDHPSAQLELNPLPSGVRFLWVTLAGRNFVLEYHPSEGTGVSENLPDTPPFVGHDRAFASLEEAITELRGLLANTFRDSDPDQRSIAATKR